MSTACGRAIHFRATSSRPIASARWRGRSRSTSRIRITLPPAWHRGRTTWISPSTSTRTCSGTGSGKSITTLARTTASSSAGGRTSATRSGTRARIRTGPAQDGQLPLIRANRAIVGDWVHIFGSSMVLNLRSSYTYYLELSRSDASLGFDATSFGWPASLVSQFPAARLGGMFPRIDIDQFEELSRGTNPRTNKIYTFQPNVSMTRGKHNVRGGMDIRRTNGFRCSLRQRRRRCHVRSPVHAPHPEQQQRVRRERVRVVPAGRPDGGSIDKPLPAHAWSFAAPWVQDDWRVTDADAERRLPLGLQQPAQRGAEPAELRFRPLDRQSCVGAVEIPVRCWAA